MSMSMIKKKIQRTQLGKYHSNTATHTWWTGSTSTPWQIVFLREENTFCNMQNYLGRELLGFHGDGGNGWHAALYVTGIKGSRFVIRAPVHVIIDSGALSSLPAFIEMELAAQFLFLRWSEGWSEAKYATFQYILLK